LQRQFLKHGLPKISYYDGAKLLDDLRIIYQNITTKLKTVKLEQATFVDFNKELVFTNGIELIKALQIFYMKSLDAFDKVLELLVGLRKEQRAKNLVTAEAFLNMYKAVSELDVAEDETFIAALAELVTTLGKLNEEAVKVMFELAKKHKDLQQLMEVHEEATLGMKKLCRNFVSLSDMSSDVGDSLSETVEPFVTLMFLSSLFG